MKAKEDRVRTEELRKWEIQTSGSNRSKEKSGNVANLPSFSSALIIRLLP